MPRSRSPSPAHHSSRHRDSRDDRERRRSRSPDRRRSYRSDERDEEGKGKGRDRERSRSRSRSPARRERSRSRDRERRRRSRSASSSSGSDSEDSRERRHRRKRRSKNKDGKLDSKGRTKEERRERRQEKKDKKERKLKKKRGIEVVEWGKHGILAENDIYTKDQEFRAWLVEEKMINPETLSKAKEKEIFKTFMEAFNTGTLPHDKFYDIPKYEKRMDSLRNGETVETSGGGYDAQKDMDSIRSSHKRTVVETESFLDRTHLEGLRKVQNERVEMERMLKLGLKPRDSMGVRMETREEAGLN